MADREAGGYRLAMSEEIHDWLADLRDSDPAQALTVGAALTALLSEGEALGPPVVVPVRPPTPDELLDAHNAAYEEMLERLTFLRRDVADAASAGASAEEQERLTRESQREQIRVDAFRMRKETLKATYTAAKAKLMINQALAADAQDDVAAVADADSQAAEAARTMQDLAAKIRRELGYEAPADGLLVLRPSAAGTASENDVSILLGVEPPGTALLVAVVEGREATRDHQREAVLLSAEVLQQVREGQAPEAAAHTFGDARSFLREFFPDKAGDVEAGAAALLARIRAHTLAELRTRLGLTQVEVAGQMGVPLDRVVAIELAEPGATEVGTLADYVKALGGHLEVTADVGGEQVRLR
ncbi:MAG TPA: helix-turn-helix transcriptional regulator [Streptosporangiaceae bacterium]|nr:helix-turn-helix transcriptional regulator [Streptosporangiaceae bacterium]